MSSFTPTPWGIERTRDTLWVGPMRPDGIKVASIVFSLHCGPDYTDEANDQERANAAFIVKAVNSHTALVTALRAARNALTSGFNTVGAVKVIDAALEGEKDAPKCDGWIEWKGGECPVGPDVDVDARFRSGGDGNDLARYYRWDHLGQDNDIVAYRVVKP